MSPHPDDPTERALDPLDQVREILYGEVKRTQEATQNRTDARIEALTAALEQERQAREADTNALRADLARIAERLEDAKVDRTALAGWFEGLARELRGG